MGREVGNVIIVEHSVKEVECASRTRYKFDSKNDAEITKSYTDCLKAKIGTDGSEEIITPEIVEEPETYTDLAKNIVKDIYLKTTTKPLLNNAIVGGTSIILGGLLNKKLLKGNPFGLIAISLGLFSAFTYYNIDSKII